jgi:2-keto-4-pentenoate hydratase/2-oxohepta-3-ene-1,7-dioic acid hydratase in catechol pathway
MRLVTFRDADGTRIGAQEGEHIVDLARAATLTGEEPPVELRDMLALITSGAAGLGRVSALLTGTPDAAMLPRATVEVLAPIPRPRKNIFCLGRNYAEHAAESLRAIGQEVKLPDYPNVFTKAVTSVNGPYAGIPFDPRVSEQLDWEVELAVVIGRGGHHIPRADALQHVWGYTIVNDISARDLQHKPGVQWFQGKSLDGSCPMGPCIVTADEIPDPQRLRLRLWVNGALKQDDTTAHMLFDVATIIETLSRVLTLEPGDVIATGTPAGVGFGRTPPEFLKPGDVVRSEIEGIGAMENRVAAVGQ